MRKVTQGVRGGGRSRPQTVCPQTQCMPPTRCALIMPHFAGFFDARALAVDFRSIGFRECLTEVIRYLGVLEGPSSRADPVRIRLLSHQLLSWAIPPVLTKQGALSPRPQSGTEGHVSYICPDPSNITPRVNLKVNYELCVIMMHQHRFITCKKYTILVGDFDNRVGVGSTACVGVGSTWEIFVSFSKFCCEPKASLKI